MGELCSQHVSDPSQMQYEYVHVRVLVSAVCACVCVLVQGTHDWAVQWALVVVNFGAKRFEHAPPPHHVV